YFYPAALLEFSKVVIKKFKEKNKRKDISKKQQINKKQSKVEKTSEKSNIKNIE
ncbi:MAG: hypothetical protein MHPSP_000284, partial [Paramarteilia canceri]